MNRIQLNISLLDYPNEAELTESEQLLMQAAREATHKSYAPYSRFHVGAAVLLENGTIFSAGNQENAAFPSGSCAEQSVIYWVGANYPGQQIRSIAVLARPGGSEVFRPVSPCGACRQSLLEYEHRQQQPIRLLMMKPDGGVIVSESISNLLPAKFDADDLRG
jgi:cytidine deaminase